MQDQLGAERRVKRGLEELDVEKQEEDWEALEKRIDLWQIEPHALMEIEDSASTVDTQKLKPP